MTNAVEVNELTKVYDDVSAVDNVSFSLESGRIYGLLGRNGAGKTTLMQMIAAQLLPTSGAVSVFGEAPYENNRVLRQVCLIQENQRYPDALRFVDLLDLAPSFFPNWDGMYAGELVDAFQLPVKRRIKKLSRGMRSAVGVVVGLAARAPLTMFDEPYLGLDATARTVFYDRLLEDYAVHPRTIILSTHLIDEVSRILEHVILIDRGKLLLDRSADALRGVAFTATGPAPKVEEFVRGMDVMSRNLLGGTVSVTAVGRLDAADRRRAETFGLEVGTVSLQELVVKLTGEQTERKVVGVQ